MSLFVGVCFILYFLELSAGKGFNLFCENPTKVHFRLIDN